MTTRPTPRDVIAQFVLPRDVEPCLKALHHAGIRTYHEADARHGWIDDSDPDAWEVLDHDHGAYKLTRVVVIPAEADRASIEDVVATAEKADADVARIRRRATNAEPAEIGDSAESE